MLDQNDDVDVPVAFVSHASEDKSSFAEPLAHNLARLGIQPWLDKWEIRPGDSLVQRLFDEGLARVDAVILITSEYSVTKPWVREELDSATVQRITRGTRLIPIRLDTVEMPAPLQHLAWLNAERSAEDVRAAAEKIADTIHGRTLRPTVAPRPAYVATSPDIPGLNSADSFVLSEIIRKALDLGHLPILDWDALAGRIMQAGLSEGALLESMHALAEADYLDVEFRGPQVFTVKLTRFGFGAGVEALVPDVHEAHRRCIAALVNGSNASIEVAELAQRIDSPKLVVQQLVLDLQDKNLLSVTRSLVGMRVNRISPTLRRLLD